MKQLNDTCPSCSQYGHKVELFTKGSISRCPRCLRSTENETPGKEYYEFLKRDESMNKIIHYINENEINEMVKQIVNQKKDIPTVIQQIKDARTEMQIKTQNLQWELEKYLQESK